MLEQIGPRTAVLKTGLVAKADHRPVLAWVTVTLAVSTVMVVPGNTLGDALPSLVPPETFLIYVLGPLSLVMLAVAALASYAIAKLPRAEAGIEAPVTQ